MHPMTTSATYGGHIPANSSTEACSLDLQRTFISNFFSDRIDRKKPTSRYLSSKFLKQKKDARKVKESKPHVCEFY